MALSTDQKTLVAEALVALLERVNTDAFLIVEEAKTQKFVQFAGSAEEPLLFDLPAQGLSEAELERAKAVLLEYNIKYEGTPIYEDETMKEQIDTQYGFTAVLDDNIELAVEISERIFEEVYGFKNLDLVFIEN